MKTIIIVAAIVVFLNADSFTEIGQQSFNRGLQFDNQANFLKAAKYYRDSCYKGITLGCIKLGDLYKNGRGVQQSFLNAANLYSNRHCAPIF